jgi:hypothetical protein
LQFAKASGMAQRLLGHSDMFLKIWSRPDFSSAGHAVDNFRKESGIIK